MLIFKGRDVIVATLFLSAYLLLCLEFMSLHIFGNEHKNAPYHHAYATFAPILLGIY